MSCTLSASSQPAGFLSAFDPAPAEASAPWTPWAAPIVAGPTSEGEGDEDPDDFD